MKIRAFSLKVLPSSCCGVSLVRGGRPCLLAADEYDRLLERLESRTEAIRGFIILRDTESANDTLWSSMHDQDTHDEPDSNAVSA